MSKNNTLCIAEWQSFGVKDIKAVIADKSKAKAKNIFKELKNFADDKGNHIFLNSYGKNRLKARNYVGLIQTKSGFCLEILPKTFRTANENEGFKNHQNKINEAKDILLKMLQTLRDSPFKQSHISNLKTHKFPLLEIFANMFLDELECLIKRGIKSDYVERTENRTFLKGKLLFTQNLKQNLTHKERFYTASDEFIADIAPNRLIVSTLLLLNKCNFSTKTSTRILQSRFVFDEIRQSSNYDKDFAKCANLRHFKSYEILLLWCKIFLKRHNFMPYQGDKKAFALLFKMQKLFENFVAWHLKKALTNHTIKAQDKSKYLIKGDKFNIKPDLVIYHKNAKLENPPKIIADTKWKILDFSKDDCGISQGDLYQLFAYLAKYECENGLLIFPKIDGESAPQTFIYKAKSNLGEAKCHKLQIHFFDCQNPSEILRFAESTHPLAPSAREGDNF
ncbi:McrC family protein [Helicobacter sp. 23-1045]